MRLLPVAKDFHPISGPSIDYVFDGTSPPYTPASKTNPLQLYGQTKRDGEEVVQPGPLKASKTKNSDQGLKTWGAFGCMPRSKGNARVRR